MWVSEEERNLYLKRVREEEMSDRSGMLKAKEFRDLRRVVKLLNNIIVTDSSRNIHHGGILFHDIDNRRLSEKEYQLMYDGKEALEFIKEVKDDYTLMIRKREYKIDSTGINIMFDYLFRTVVLTDSKNDLVPVSKDRVMLFRNDVAMLADQENRT